MGFIIVACNLHLQNSLTTCLFHPCSNVVTGKTGHLTRPEKNARLKALFKKVKRSVNAVGGSNHRKKYLWVKVTEHKSKTIIKVSPFPVTHFWFYKSKVQTRLEISVLMLPRKMVSSSWNWILQKYDIMNQSPGNLLSMLYTINII